MKAREFDSEEEGLEALKEAPEGAILSPVRWQLRLPSWEERAKQEEFEEQAVRVGFVSFLTRADLYELDDDDLLGLGRMVVQMARWQRNR